MNGVTKLSNGGLTGLDERKNIGSQQDSFLWGKEKTNMDLIVAMPTPYPSMSDLNEKPAPSKPCTNNEVTFSTCENSRAEKMVSISASAINGKTISIPSNIASEEQKHRAFSKI